MMHSCSSWVATRQRGAALLTAMLMVVLVATLASGMLWQQWRGVEVEQAQRTRVQAAWVLTGALDWARLILREDARQGGADHLAEPWAVPLEPARLSTFLAAERGQANADEDGAERAFLAGHIQDQQALLNVTNLVDGKLLHKPSVAAWQRLFEHLNLPDAELTALTQALLQLKDIPAPERDPLLGRPLQPQRAADLVWLGLSARTLQTLLPYITLLPVRTTVNLNTAPPEVLLAVVPDMDLARARALVQARARQHMGTLADADLRVNDAAIHFDAAAHGVTSRFFSVTGQLRLGDATLQEVSLLQRDGLDVKILSRQREVLTPAQPTLQ